MRLPSSRGSAPVSLRCRLIPLPASPGPPPAILIQAVGAVPSGRLFAKLKWHFNVTGAHRSIGATGLPKRTTSFVQFGGICNGSRYRLGVSARNGVVQKQHFPEKGILRCRRHSRSWTMNSSIRVAC